MAHWPSDTLTLCNFFNIAECREYLFGVASINTKIICKAHIQQNMIQIVFMTPCTKNMSTNIICEQYSQIYLNIIIYEYFVMPGFS